MTSGKLAVLEYARESGNVAKTCRHFGMSRQCYYNWLRVVERRGDLQLHLQPEDMDAS